MTVIDKLCNGKTTSAGVIVIAVVLILNTVLPHISSSSSTDSDKVLSAKIFSVEILAMLEKGNKASEQNFTTLRDIVKGLNEINMGQERIVLIQERILHEIERIERLRAKGEG